MDATDRFAIDDLIARYSYGYDTLDWALYRSIWAADGELVLPDGTTYAGVDAVVEHARSRREDLAARIQTRHHQTNTRVEAPGPERVRTRTMLLVAWQHDGEPGPVLMHTGEYHDELVRQPEGWRLARRTLVIDHA